MTTVPILIVSAETALHLATSSNPSPGSLKGPGLSTKSWEAPSCH